jgi:glutaredoxin 2
MVTELTKISVALTVGGALGAAATSLFATQRALRSSTKTPSAAKATAPATVSALPAILPKLFIYDHCSYCVRARVIFGLKKVPHELVFLANHDEATPIALVGSKQAPILLPPGGAKAFPESMEIVRFVDTTYGNAELLEPSSGRSDLQHWIKDSAECFRLLYHPRFHASHFAEFAQRESREYYRVKKEKTIGPFPAALARTPELVVEANAHLEQLAAMFHSNRSVNAALSYDDIDVFGRLRSLTLVKDLQWPQKLREYMDYMAEAADVPLLDSMAM